MPSNFKPNSKGFIMGTEDDDEINYQESWNKAITVNASGGNDKVDFSTSTYDNKLYAGSGGDLVYGGNGNDTLEGGNGNDTIDGGKGNDRIFGADGDDLLYGGDGDDLITGGAGNNAIYGGNGNDNIQCDNIYEGEASNKKNYLYGGTDSDTYVIYSDEPYIHNYHTIYDDSGDNDNILFSRPIYDYDDYKTTVVSFDLEIDQSGNIIESSSKNMYFTNTDSFMSETNGIMVKDQFVDGHGIEKLTIANYWYITSTEINNLRHDVAN